MLRKFFHIRHLSNVTEYIEHFCDLTHQILAHDPSLPPSVITNRFIDGLKKEINVIMVHRPQDLDFTSSLALLQEEVMMDNIPIRRHDSSSSGRKSYQEPTGVHGFTAGHSPKFSPSPGEDRRNVEGNKQKVDDKLVALKSFRKSKGCI